MTTTEARAFIANGLIDRAVLNRRNGEDWRILLYGDNLQSTRVNQIEATTWPCLDEAHDWLKLADGARLRIETDGLGAPPTAHQFLALRAAKAT